MERGEGAVVVHVGERTAHLDRDRVAVDLDALVVALVLERALVLVAVQEERRLVRRAVRQLGDREGPLHRVGDVLGLHIRTVLVLQAVLEGEGPLGVVLVGLAEVGGHVRHQLHVVGVGVVDVLGQRPGDQVRQDRGRVGVVGLGRVQRRRHVRGQHREGAALRRVRRHLEGALQVGVLERTRLAPLAGTGADALVGAGVVVVVRPAASTRGSERHQGRSRECTAGFSCASRCTHLSWLVDASLRCRSPASLGVEGVAHGVAEEVQRHDEENPRTRARRGKADRC